MPGMTDVLEGVKDTITVRRVYGDPIERGDTTVVPAASVMGGGGGGEGGEGEAQGAGTGFGVRARPVGAYVIRDGDVTWHPAFDVMRTITAGVMVAVLGAVMASGMMRRRSKNKMPHQGRVTVTS